LNWRVAGLGEVPAGSAAWTGLGVGEFILAVTGVAVGAVDERVREVGEVTARLPDLGWGEDRGVEADHVVAVLDHRAPPGILDVAQQQDPERAVVVCRTKTAVDLR